MEATNYGKEYLAYLNFPTSKEKVTIYYWDVWISLLLESKHCNGSIEDLLEVIRPSKYSDLSQKEAYEALHNEIRSYEQKLVTNQIQAADILEKLQEIYTDTDFLKTQFKTAYIKIIKLDFEEEDKTVKMKFTPRKLKKEAALRGYFITYWIGPEQPYTEALEEGQPLDYTDDIKELFEASYVSLEKKYYRYPFMYDYDDDDFKDESLLFPDELYAFVKQLKAQGLKMDVLTNNVAKKIASQIKRLSKKLNIYKSFALYRAVMTVIIEHTDKIDDASGNIAKIAQDAFKKYISLDKSEVAMTPLDFYMDLLNLMIWEDYGYFEDYWPAVFKNLTSEDVEAIEFILQEEKEELDQGELNEMADKIPTFLGLLYGQNKLFDQFIPTATMMGTKNLNRVIQLAIIAEENQQPDLAKAVYEAALQDKKGFYYKHLRQKYERIK